MMEMRKKQRGILCCMLLTVGLVLVGCGKKTTEPPPPKTTLPPIKAAVMPDKTGSANSTRTVQPQLEDFEPFIERIKKSGGELGIGLVSDDSNKPLIRLRIDIPPQPPTKPNEEGDADEIAEKDAKYEADVKVYNLKTEEWHSETERRVTKFKDEVKTLLDQPPKAKKSDVFNALNRADLFLAEQDNSFPNNTEKIIILNSDAQDNVRAKFEGLRSNARLIVVNGVGSVGSLTKLKPERFESLSSAINQVINGGK